MARVVIEMEALKVFHKSFYYHHDAASRSAAIIRASTECAVVLSHDDVSQPIDSGCLVDVLTIRGNPCPLCAVLRDEPVYR